MKLFGHTERMIEDWERCVWKKDEWTQQKRKIKKVVKWNGLDPEKERNGKFKEQMKILGIINIFYYDVNSLEYSKIF